MTLIMYCPGRSASTSGKLPTIMTCPVDEKVGQGEAVHLQLYQLAAALCICLSTGILTSVGACGPRRSEPCNDIPRPEGADHQRAAPVTLTSIRQRHKVILPHHITHQTTGKGVHHAPIVIYTRHLGPILHLTAKSSARGRLLLPRGTSFQAGKDRRLSA